MPKKENVLIIGASDNPERYSYKAQIMLQEFGHQPYGIGSKDVTVNNMDIKKGYPDFALQIDTVTMYINPKLQEDYYQYIIKINPKRVIFNPGTENPVFEKMLNEKGILTENACTLVLLGTGQF